MWHRIPSESDEVEATIDCFGRDKYLEYKKDMGGVGSFNFDNRTLYVGRVTVSDDMEDIVRRHFSEWGPIESGKGLLQSPPVKPWRNFNPIACTVKVLKRRGVAFVTYQMRSNAEFAKEAMKYQSLDNNEMLNIRWVSNSISYSIFICSVLMRWLFCRWASDDPNPTPAVSEVPEKKRKTEAQYADDGESELPAEYTSRAQEVDEDGFMNMEMRIKLERAAEAERSNRRLQEQTAALNYWNYYQQEQPATTVPEAAQVQETDKKDSIISSQALETLKQLQQKNAGAAKKQGGGLQALATYGSDSEDDD
jgi:RNA recognition motif-containing protein